MPLLYLCTSYFLKKKGNEKQYNTRTIGETYIVDLTDPYSNLPPSLKQNYYAPPCTYDVLVISGITNKFPLYKTIRET